MTKWFSSSRLIFVAAAIMLVAALLAWKWLVPDTAAQKAAGQARAAELVQRAEQAMEAGRAAAARKWYQQALEEDPGNPQALLHTASSLQQDGRLEDASALLQRITAAPDSLQAKVRYLQAVIAQQQHQLPAAERLFLEAAKLNPTWPPPLRDLAPLYAVQMRTVELSATLSRLEALRPLTAEELAMRLLAAELIVPEESAVEQLQQALVGDPADASSLRALILIRLHQGDTAAAIQILDEAPALEAASTALQELRLLVEARGGQTEFHSPLLSTLQLQPESTTDALLAALQHPGITAVPQHRLAIARSLALQLPWSTMASHALAEAFTATGDTAAAGQQHIATRRLDQLELLAYRVFRPQAAIPDMALPLYLEISGLLVELGRADEARKWLALAEKLPASDAARAQLAGRRETLAGNAGQTSEQAADILSQLAQIPPILIQKIPQPQSRSSAPVTHEPQTNATHWSFVDAAARLKLDFSYHNGQSPERRIVETIGGGSAVLDLDGDDWPDLFLPQVKPFEDRLFRNLRGQQFADCSAVCGLAGTGHGLAAAAGDFDSDGLPDLCVARLGTCVLLRNNGDGTFSDATPAALQQQTGCSSGACFADISGDGLPELFVLNYVEDWDRRCVNSEGRYAVCDPRELRPALNRLYANLGTGEFADITESSGVAAMPGRALGIIAADLTCDGRLDLFVANDGLPNSLLTVDAANQPAGKLTAAADIRLQNIAAQSGVAVPESGRAHAGMGVAAADFNSDALPDLLVTNFYREANTLYQSAGCGLFADLSQLSGAGPPSLQQLGFGVQPLDADCDGFMDVVILNGDIDDYSSTGRPWKMPMGALQGMAEGRFRNMSGLCGDDFDVPQLGRGLSRLDFDRDGRADLVGVRHDGPIRLFHNQTPAVHPMVRLRLIGTASDRSAVGTAVDSLDAGGRRQRYWLTAGDGFAASNEPQLMLVAAGGQTRVTLVNVAAGIDTESGSGALLPAGSWACRLRPQGPPLFFRLPEG